MNTVGMNFVLTWKQNNWNGLAVAKHVNVLYYNSIKLAIFLSRNINDA